MAISPINLGNTFSSINGNNTLSGLSSGLDTSSIINSLVSGQTSQVTKLQDQITVNNNQTTALSTMNQLLTQLKTATAALASPQSPDSTSNLFAFRTSTVTSNMTQDASNFLTATVATSATTGTYTISNISQVAQATIQETGGFTIANADTSVVAASSTAGRFTAGTFTLNGQSITLTAGETLNQVASAFNAANAASPSTGISANVLQTAPGVFKLILTGSNTGVSNGFDLNRFQTNTISVASADAATGSQFTAGTYTVNGQSVTISANESLNNIAAAFNNAGAGVTASVVQVASGSYKIVFTGNTVDLSNNVAAFDLASSANVTSDPSGVLQNILLTTDQTAQDAKFMFNGVSIDRTTNNVNDLVNGVTFNLLQNTNNQTNPTITVTVSPDTTSISNGIQNFVSAYNNFLTFYAQQTQIDSTTGAPASSAVLYSDTTLRNVFNQLSAQAASVVAGLTSGSADTLADLGIGFTDQPATSTTPAVANVLSIDSTTLNNALTTNLTGVENVFGYNDISSSSHLQVFQGPNDQSISSFAINVDQVNQVYTATYTDASGHQQTINLQSSQLGTNALSLTAPSTSGLAGLILVYGGSGSENNIAVTTTNGVANMMNILANAATTTQTGLIASDQSAIATNTTNLQTQITNINTQISNTKNSLLTKFSALEAAITAANSSLNYLNAQQLAASSH